MEKINKIILGLFVILATSVIVLNVVKYVSNGNMQYSYVTYLKTYDDIDTYGMFLRDEEIMDEKIDKLTYLVVDSGKKIAKGDTIAMLYQEEKYLDLSIELDDLYEQKELLESVTVSSQVDQDSTQTSMLLNSKIATLALNLQEGNFSESIDDIDDVKNSLLKNTYSQMELDEFAEVQVELESQIATLESQITNQVDNITSPRAGYFIYGIDGYENIEKDQIDVEYLSQAYEDDIELDYSNVFGKIATGFNWQLAVVVENEQVTQMKQASKLRILIEDLSDKEILVDIVDVVVDGDKSIVYLQSNFINEDILQTRVTDVKIILREYEGLQVPKESTRIVDGVMGIYCLRGYQAVFKEINIILEKENYYLIDFNGIDIINGDKVIIESKELTDKQVIK